MIEAENNHAVTRALERRVMVRLTSGEINTLIELLKMMDATSDDRDPDYVNFGVLRRKFSKWISATALSKSYSEPCFADIAP